MKIFINPPTILKGAATAWTKRFDKIFSDRNFTVTYRIENPWDSALFISESTNIERAVETQRPVGYRVANAYLSEWFHIFGKSMKPSHHLMNAAISSGLQKATVVFYQSLWAKNQLDQFLAPRIGPSQIIYNGVNLELFTPDRTQRLEEPVLGTVGILRYRYRLETFFELSRKLELPHRCLIVGSLDPVCKKILSRYLQIPEYHGRIEWVDFVPHSKLPEFYNRMSILIHPVMGDACPNVVCEALACGVPVVAPEFGGTSELLGNGGIAFPSDPWIYDEKFIDQLVSSTRSVLLNRNAFSLAARHEAIQKLDIEKMADQYLEALGLPLRCEKIFKIPHHSVKPVRKFASKLFGSFRFYSSLALRKSRQSTRKYFFLKVNKKPKIAFTLFDFQVGGIENWLYRLAAELSTDFEFYFLSTRASVFLPKFQQVGRCVFLPNPLIMAHYLEKEHINLVQVHNERWPVDAALAAGVPKVIERLGGQRSWRRISKSGLDFIIASSKMAAESVKDMISHEKICVIYNGIDLEAVDATLPQRLFSPDQTIIGRSSRFGRGQNLTLLILALEKLLPVWPDLRLVLVGGDSPLPGADAVFSELNLFVKKLGLDRFVHFTGQVDDAGPFIKGFDIGTCVSNDEGLPNSLIEAMASKKAVVSSDVGAISELIQDGENGLLFEPGNTNAFCAKIELLLLDLSVREKLERNAYQTIHDRFNIHHSARQYADLYRELLSR